MESNERILKSVIDEKIYSEKIVDYDLDLTKWKIKKLYKDTLWVKLLDEPSADLYKKGHLFVKPNSTKGPYRFGEVILCGEDVKDASVKDRIIFPRNVGQPGYREYENYNTWFVKEDAIMAVIEFDGTDDELQEHIEKEFLKV